MTSEPSIDGVLVVDKPAGPTSHDIVAAARRALGVKRIGHTGTLDPRASGVLPLVIGRATRLARFLSGREKAYLADVGFGRRSDTYDTAGVIETVPGPLPSAAAVEAALAGFRGTYLQVPPGHSAKKVDGVRAYERARAALPVALQPVEVHVASLDLVAFDGRVARLAVVCSAGFYVRRLAHELGAALGTGGLLERLVRTAAGAYTLDDAVDPGLLGADHRAEVRARVRPLEALLPELPGVTLTPDGDRRARHGQALGPGSLAGAPPVGTGGPVRLIGPDGRLVGIARVGPTGALHPSLVLG